MHVPDESSLPLALQVQIDTTDKDLLDLVDKIIALPEQVVA